MANDLAEPTEQSQSILNREHYIYDLERPRSFEWFRQFPRWRGCNPRRAQFITDAQLANLISALGYEENSEAARRLLEDKKHLDTELLPLFQARDIDAHCNQNSYRRYQLGFMFLAAVATLIGSLQVWALNDNPDWIVRIGLAETLVALLTTYIATLKGNEHPFSAWLHSRQLAEQLRREYYRYLTDTMPYTELTGPTRRKLLALRAAAINRGDDPEAQDKDTL